MAEGKNPRTIARELYKDVKNRVDKIGKVRSRMIARTEIVRAHHIANIQEYRQAEVEGVKVQAEWVTGAGACPICIGLAEDKVYTLDEIEALIPAHPNCVVQGTSIVASDVLRGLSANYSGEIVKLAFVNGARLSVTANHMLLTPHGFVMAKFLSDGDTVFSGFNGERSTGSDPNDDRNPAAVEKIIKAFAESLGVSTCSVPVSAEYLHGDGSRCEGYIDIVNPDCFLRSHLNATLMEILNHFQFKGSSVLDILTSARPLELLSQRLLSASDSSMGGSREALAFLRGCLLHAQKHGCASISRRDALFLQPSVDDASIAANMLRDLFDRPPGMIKLEDLLNIYRGAVMGTASNLQINSNFQQSALERIAFFHSIGVSDFGKAFAGLIAPVSVSSVEFEHVKNLRVFDITTSASMYFANGVVSSNCGCVAKPIPLLVRGRTRVAA